eukprot:6459855-Amphidinium_carterae.1
MQVSMTASDLQGCETTGEDSEALKWDCLFKKLYRRTCMTVLCSTCLQQPYPNQCTPWARHKSADQHFCLMIRFGRILL